MTWHPSGSVKVNVPPKGPSIGGDDGVAASDAGIVDVLDVGGMQPDRGTDTGLGASINRGAAHGVYKNSNA